MLFLCVSGLGFALCPREGGTRELYALAARQLWFGHNLHIPHC